jgi:hypothetical protein
VFKQVNKLLLFLALLWALVPPSTQAQVINCPSGFASTGSCAVSTNSGDAFWLVGGMSGTPPGLSGSDVILMPSGSAHRAMSLMYQTQVNVQAFTSTFRFVPNGQNLVFIINNSTNNPYGFNNNAFSEGAGCEADFFQGYNQTNPPNNVFALEFDSVNPLVNGNAFTYSSVQIYTSNPYVQCPCQPSVQGCGTNNGDSPIIKLGTFPVPLNSPANTWLTTTGDTYSATVTYDGTNLTLNLFDVTAGDSCPGPNCFTHTWNSVDIPASGDGNTAWVGFGGATRDAPSSYPLYINSFVYNEGTATSTPTPKPTPTATSTATPKPTPTPVKKHKKWYPPLKP